MVPARFFFFERWLSADIEAADPRNA